MAGKGVQRAVVHQGENLGGGRDVEFPGLLGAGEEFRVDVLARDGQGLVVPRDGDLAHASVEAVLPHEEAAEEEGSPVLPGDRPLQEADRPDGVVRLIEEGLPLLHEGDPAIARLVAASPEEADLPADVDGVVFQLKEVGDRHGEARGLRIEHEQFALAGHLLPARIRRLEDHPVGADREGGQLAVPDPVRGGRDGEGGDRFPGLPTCPPPQLRFTSGGARVGPVRVGRRRFTHWGGRGF